VRGRWVACGLAVALAAGGCTSSGGKPGAAATVAASAPAWTEPAKYGYVLDRRCGSGPSDGRYRVAVAGGQVASADRIDGKTASGEEEIDVPTLRDLLDMAGTATDDGAKVTTEFDRTDGHPVAVSIDNSDGSPACFAISDYQPAG
jgi:Family of unknown function (DUF6174)